MNKPVGYACRSRPLCRERPSFLCVARGQRHSASARRPAAQSCPHRGIIPADSGPPLYRSERVTADQGGSHSQRALRGVSRRRWQATAKGGRRNFPLHPSRFLAMSQTGLNAEILLRKTEALHAIAGRALRDQLISSRRAVIPQSSIFEDSTAAHGRPIATCSCLTARRIPAGRRRQGRRFISRPAS